MNRSDCFFRCTVALVVILMLIVAGNYSMGANPFDFLLKQKQVKKPTATKTPGTICKTPITANDFVYMMSHKKRTTVRAQYENSDKSMCFVDYLKGHDKRYVKILKVNQQLQFSGLSFKCYCGCVKPTEWNHHVVPSKYKVDTRLTLTVNGNTSKCKCGCKQI